MSETKLATKADLQEMYQRILPYLGGSADAGFTPIGTIIAVMGKNAPANYLPCDGRVVNISDYPELANYFKEQFGSSNYFGGDGTTTFGIVDLSGEFLRGTGTNSHENQGRGADVGVHQNATEILPMAVTTPADARALLIYTDDSAHGTSNADSSLGNSLGAAYYNSDKHSSSSCAVDKAVKLTTRPTNTSVLYCIATKNIYLNPSLDYSTDEKVVGTWIDGKPLYQKTIPFTVPTPTINGVAVTETIPNSELSDVADVLYLEGYYTDSSHALFNFVDKTATRTEEPAFQSTCITIFYVESINAFQVSCSILSHGGRTGHITVRYTKTT